MESIHSDIKIDKLYIQIKRISNWISTSSIDTQESESFSQTYTEGKKNSFKTCKVYNFAISKPLLSFISI